MVSTRRLVWFGFGAVSVIGLFGFGFGFGSGSGVWSVPFLFASRFVDLSLPPSRSFPSRHVVPSLPSSSSRSIINASLLQCIVMKDRETGRSRGFGFVVGVFSIFNHPFRLNLVFELFLPSV